MRLERTQEQNQIDISIMIACAAFQAQNFVGFNNALTIFAICQSMFEREGLDIYKKRYQIGRLKTKRRAVFNLNFS